MEAEISEVCFAGVFLLDGIRTLALQAGLNIIFDPAAFNRKAADGTVIRSSKVNEDSRAEPQRARRCGKQYQICRKVPKITCLHWMDPKSPFPAERSRVVIRLAVNAEAKGRGRVVSRFNGSSFLDDPKIKWSQNGNSNQGKNK